VVEVRERVRIPEEEDGVLLPVRSQFPSPVVNFTAKRRMSRSAPAAPRSPAKGENRTKTPVFLPVFPEIFARVYS